MSHIEHILASQNQLGEGPIWDDEHAQLIWVDINRGAIHRFRPQSEEHTSESLGVPIGCLGLRKHGGLVLATKDGFAFWEEGESQLNPFLNPESDRPHARFNDGSVDPAGRFWAGTMTTDTSDNVLYCLDPDLSHHVMESNIMISNGIGWSPDQRTMYFTDSPRRLIYAYNYDVPTGAIENRRTFVHSLGEPGVPDGLCVDQDGCVWSAQWDGWKIIRYDPDGKPMQNIELPVQRPTSCTFGGTDLDILYITSASIDLSEGARKEQPMAGDLFMFQTETRGLHENRFLG